MKEPDPVPVLVETICGVCGHAIYTRGAEAGKAAWLDHREYELLQALKREVQQARTDVAC